MDNLESQTYEVFEKDPIKYSQYQQVRADTRPLSWRWTFRATSLPVKEAANPKLESKGACFHLRPQAVRKCLLDRVPDEQKETNVQ